MQIFLATFDMISAVQTPGIDTVNNLPSAARIDSLTRGISPSLAVSSVRLSLGNGSTPVLTYSQAGLFATPVQPSPSRGAAVAVADSTDTPAVASTDDIDSIPRAVGNTPGALAGADPTAAAVTTLSVAAITEAISAATTTVETLAGAPATAGAGTESATGTSAAPANASAATATEEAAVPPAPAAPAVAPAPAATPLPGTIAATPAAANMLGINFVFNPVSQVLTNITANPAYAGMAASLYVNVAIYRTQQASAPALLSKIDTPEPVSGVGAATGVDIERSKEEAANDRRHEASLQRGISRLKRNT